MEVNLPEWSCTLQPRVNSSGFLVVVTVSIVVVVVAIVVEVVVVEVVVVDVVVVEGPCMRLGIQKCKRVQILYEIVLVERKQTVRGDLFRYQTVTTA